jgi:hypothetical protein
MLELLLHRTKHRSGAPAGRRAEFGRDVAPFRDGAGVLQEVLAREIGHADRLFPGQAVARGQQDDPRLGHQRTDLEPALVDGQADVADVRAAIVDHIGLIVPGGADDLDGQVRPRLTERPHRRGHDQPGHEADREGMRSAGGLPDTSAHRLRAGQQGPRVGQQLFTGRRELGGPLGPYE